MKKNALISLSLLVLMLYNVVGFVGVFRYARHEWRHQMQQRIASEDLSNPLVKPFIFHRTDFDCGEREFEKDGVWYDVIKYETLGDSLQVFALPDVYETDLVEAFNNIVKNSDTQNSDFQNKTIFLFKNLIKEYYAEKFFELTPPSVENAFPTNNFVEKTLKTSIWRNVLSPPPRLLS